MLDFRHDFEQELIAFEHNVDNYFLIRAALDIFFILYLQNLELLRLKAWLQSLKKLAKTVCEYANA